MNGRTDIKAEDDKFMENIAFLTGIANDFDIELAKTLSENGYKVYSYDMVNEIDHIDLYIDTSNYKPENDKFTVSDEIDYDLIKTIYTENVLKPIAMYEELLPLMKAGSLKRYCFITSANAGINQNADTSGYGYNMSKAGLHNFLQIIKNKLMPQGFTFRAFDPSALSPDKSSKSAYNYFTRRRGVEGRDDEPKFRIRDAFGREYSW